jgi:hypothetical protein
MTGVFCKALSLQGLDVYSLHIAIEVDIVSGLTSIYGLIYCLIRPLLIDVISCLQTTDAETS